MFHIGYQNNLLGHCTSNEITFTFPALSILKNCIYRIENWENIHNVNANDVKNGGDINKPAQAIIYQVLLFEDADSRFL